MIDKKERSVLGDVFDRTVRALDGMPEVTKTKATTVRSLTPVLELSQTFIVQTYRRKDHGDTVLVEYIGKDGSIRLALPPEVTEVIARQRDALISKVRSAQAKAAAADRKARGIAPGFMKGKK
jgi:hypothetical protein